MAPGGACGTLVDLLCTWACAQYFHGARFLKLLRLLTVKIQSKAPESLEVISLWWEGEGGFEAVLGEHLGC